MYQWTPQGVRGNQCNRKQFRLSCLHTNGFLIISHPNWGHELQRWKQIYRNKAKQENYTNTAKQVISSLCTQFLLAFGSHFTERVNKPTRGTDTYDRILNGIYKRRNLRKYIIDKWKSLTLLYNQLWYILPFPANNTCPPVHLERKSKWSSCPSLSLLSPFTPPYCSPYSPSSSLPLFSLPICFSTSPSEVDL